MKITKVDAIQIEDKPADQPGWRPIVCRVYTDTGLYGDGEAAIAYGVGSTANDSGSGKIDNRYEPVGYRSYLGKII